MKTIRLFTLFILFLCCFSVPSCTKFEKVKNESFPDFCQCDRSYGTLPREGKPYCGPTALSNVLVYLDRNGFSNLLTEENPSSQAQFNLIKLLGSKKYADTSLTEGTEPANLMKGLEKYVKEMGYDISIKWKGWTDGGIYTVGRVPDPIWLKDELAQFSYAILQVGWYKYDPKQNFYKRIGGHYVSIVDFVNDKKGLPRFIIHDPSIRSGIKEKDEYCKLFPLAKGTLSEWHKYKARSGEGYSIIDGIKVKEEANVGIVDGVFVFKLFHKSREKKTIKYFSYGSNMSIKRMKNDKGVNVLSRVPAILKDYELKFNKTARANPKEGKANIVPSKGKTVEGILYDVSEADLKNLDISEGYPEHYNRIKVMLFLRDGKEMEAFVYVAQKDKVKEGLMPTRKYLNYLLDGKDFLSSSYYDKLKAIKTLD